MRILLCVFVALFTAASAEAGEFHVNSEQYQRVLELLQAEGIIPNVTNRCEIDIDNTYLCTAKSSEVTILYRATKQGDNLTNITIGATAKNIQTAARVAAMACLSLDDEWPAMGTSPKALSILSEQITIIVGIMTKTYVRGELDYNESEFCKQFYINNERGNMTIVRVTAKLTHLILRPTTASRPAIMDHTRFAISTAMSGNMVSPTLALSAIRGRASGRCLSGDSSVRLLPCVLPKLLLTLCLCWEFMLNLLIELVPQR